MNGKVWFDGLTIIAVALLLLAACLVSGAITADWKPMTLILLAAAAFVAREYQW